MSKITLQGYIVVPDSDLELVEAELPFHITNTRQETGCLLFRVTQDKTNKNIFNVYEEFKDKLSFESHQARVRESKWGKITKSVERHYQITEDDC